MKSIVVSSFYQFTRLPAPAQLRDGLLAQMRAHRVLGTVLLADEGVNATICGAPQAVDAVTDYLIDVAQLAPLTPKQSLAAAPPFKRARVKIKREIVTLGVGELRAGAGAVRVAPRDWNALLDDDATLIIDVRNEYETAIGAFDRAIDPHTVNFREFPAFVERRLDAARDQKIAMYCTGGIRCEKSTSYLTQRGFAQVFHLQGGILNYLDCVAPSESRWRGACFVFDERVALDHNLTPGKYDQCHACRRPISAEDKRDRRYVSGVSCAHCFARTNQRAHNRFVEREKQVALAAQRGDVHFGPEAMQPRNKLRREVEV